VEAVAGQAMNPARLATGWREFFIPAGSHAGTAMEAANRWFGLIPAKFVKDPAESQTKIPVKGAMDWGFMSPNPHPRSADGLKSPICEEVQWRNPLTKTTWKKMNWQGYFSPKAAWINSSGI
jgi:hypothetical protein